MDKQLFESYVYCPACHNLVNITMRPVDDSLESLTGNLLRNFGLDVPSEHFGSVEKQCECGKSVKVFMSVTADNFK